MVQMKEQDKTPDEEWSEVKISNLLDRDFKVVTVKLFEEFWRRLDKKGEKLEIYNKELENIKNQTELQNTIT